MNWYKLSKFVGEEEFDFSETDEYNIGYMPNGDLAIFDLGLLL